MIGIHHVVHAKRERERERERERGSERERGREREREGEREGGRAYSISSVCVADRSIYSSNRSDSALPETARQKVG